MSAAAPFATPLATALCLIGGLASAECFGPEDLTRGVVFEYPGGDYTTIQRQGDGAHLVTESYGDGSAPFGLRAYRGIYFVEEWEITPSGGRAPGSGLTIEFPVDPARLPEPVPGLNLQGQTINYFESGGTRDETTILSAIEGGPITLGGCTYETVTVDLRYDWGDEGGLSLRYRYLPELGTATLEWSQFDGEQNPPSPPIGLRRATK